MEVPRDATVLSYNYGEARGMPSAVPGVHLITTGHKFKIKPYYACTVQFNWEHRHWLSVS